MLAASLLPDLLTQPERKVASTFRFKTPEEKRLHAWVMAECQDMIDYARPSRELGTDAIKGYMNVVHKSTTYKKDRSDISFPYLHSVIYSGCAIEAATAPKVKFKAKTEEDEPNMKWIEATIKNSEKGTFNRPPVDHVYFEQVFDKRLLGVGAVYVGFEFQTRVVFVRDASGKWVEKTMVVEDDIVERNIDFFNFGVSRDTKPGMYGGSRCYWDEFYDESSFFDKYGNNPFYNHVNKDEIPDGDWFMGGADSSAYRPQCWKGIYRVRQFRDIVNNLHYEIANGIPMRVDHILDYGDPKNPKTMLPICTIHNDFAFDYDRPSALNKFARQNNRFYTGSNQVSTNKSFWSKPESLIVKPMIAAKNTFGRAMIDWLKASSVQFVIGPTGVIDRINKGKLYGIEPIKLDVGSFETKSLVQNSTFLNDFGKADAFLDNTMFTALGRDISRPVRDNPAQATVDAAQRQQEQQRDAQNARYNATGGIVRKYWIKYNLVKQYIPLPRKVSVNNVGQIEDAEEHRILRDADGKPLLLLNPKVIDIGFPVAEVKTTKRRKIRLENGDEVDQEETSFRLVDPSHSEAQKQGAPGQNFFNAREDYFVTKADPEITIEDLSSFQEDNALAKAVIVEQLQALTPFLALSVNGKPILPPEFVTFLIINASDALGLPVQEVKDLLKGDSKAKEEEEAVAPPPFTDEQDMAAAAAGQAPMPPMAQVMGAPGADTAAPGSIEGLTKQGSPPKAGASLNSGASLAASLQM